MLPLLAWVHLQNFPWDHFPAWPGNQSHVRDIWIHCCFMWHLALINSNEEMAVWDFLTSHEIHFAGQRLLTDGSNLGLPIICCTDFIALVWPFPLLGTGPFFHLVSLEGLSFSKAALEHLVKACSVQQQGLGMA